MTAEPRMISGEESAEILAEHVPYPTDPECIECGERWPCLPYHLAYTVEVQAAQIAAVLAIHQPSTDHDPAGDPYCVGCWQAGGFDGAPTYPCPTARACGVTP